MNRRATTLALLAAMTCALTVQSLPVAADAQCKLILVEEWKVRWVNNHILIDGAINGQPVGVLLDKDFRGRSVRRSQLCERASRHGLAQRATARHILARDFEIDQAVTQHLLRHLLSIRTHEG